MIFEFARMSDSGNPWMGSSATGALGPAIVGASILGAYLLGGFTAAYYFVRWRLGTDIRSTGTGTAGATNVGRLLGKQAFVLVFLVDLLKGGAVVAIAGALGLGPWALALVAVAVTAGHVWPLQLGFRGGKGIATSLGALMVYDARALGVLVGVFLAAFVVCRRFTLGGLIGYALCPLALWLSRAPLCSVVCTAALACVVWVAHRGNLRRDSQRLVTKTAKPGNDRTSPT